MILLSRGEFALLTCRGVLAHTVDVGVRHGEAVGVGVRPEDAAVDFSAGGCSAARCTATRRDEDSPGIVATLRASFLEGKGTGKAGGAK